MKNSGKPLRSSRKTSFPEDSLARLPPQALEFEEVVLGSMLMDKKAISKVLKIIRPEMMYKEENKTIFLTIVNMFKSNLPVDILTVTEQLRKSDELESCGGPWYISQLTNKVSSISSLEYYCTIILEKYILREWILLSANISTHAYNEIDVWELNEYANTETRRIFSLFQKATRSRQKDIVAKTFEDLNTVIASKQSNTLKTSQYCFDNRFYFSPGIILISGAGGVGKTTFLTFLMRNILKENSNVSVLWYCIDHETGKSINKKMLSMDTRIDFQRLSGKGLTLDRSEMEMILSHQSIYEQFDIEYEDKPVFISDIDMRFRTFCESRPNRYNILIIDNIMRLLDMRDPKLTQTEKDDFVSQYIADIYKNNERYNPVVIPLHHMTKDQVGKANLHTGMRPTIENIKGSGRYFDIAEMVILLNRPGLYQILLDEYPDKKDILSNLFLAEVVKNTWGPTGMTWWLCNLSFGIYKELKIFIPE